MKTLYGKDILLRALEPSDLDALYALENDETVWEVSNTVTPYSKYVLKQYLKNAHRDIYEVKQVRLVICLITTQKPIGFIDLFNFDPKHLRVGVGIVVFSEMDKRKGYATQALKQVCTYAKVHLNVHQVYANISADNKSSIDLFEKVGFKKAGEKRDWVLANGVYKNELIYQRIED